MRVPSFSECLHVISAVDERLCIKGELEPL